MPVQDGNQLARQFRRQPCFAGSVLIAVTGYADEAHRLVSATAGFDYYLIKPVEPSVLEKMLLLEQRRLLPELEQRLMKDEGAEGEQTQGGQASLEGAPNATTGPMDRS